MLTRSVQLPVPTRRTVLSAEIAVNKVARKSFELGLLVEKIKRFASEWQDGELFIGLVVITWINPVRSRISTRSILVLVSLAWALTELSERPATSNAGSNNVRDLKRLFME